MSSPRLSLSEFLLLAQREVQQVLEYLASPEARRESPELPSAVMATVGRLKLAVPVTFSTSGPALQQEPGEAEPSQEVEDGPQAAVSHVHPHPAGRVVPRGRRLLVATPEDCRLGDQLGRVEIEFITCPKH